MMRASAVDCVLPVGDIRSRPGNSVRSGLVEFWLNWTTSVPWVTDS